LYVVDLAGTVVTTAADRARRTKRLRFDAEALKSETAAIVAALMQEYSHVVDKVDLLVRVANREISRDAADDACIEEVSAALKQVVDVFTAKTKIRLPAFWDLPGMGQVCAAVVRWLYGDDLLSYTDAAFVLFDDAETLRPSTLTQRIRSLIKQGRLTPYIDPRHAQRVLLSEVEQLRLELQAEAQSAPVRDDPD
jgi:hypothetical protein